MNDRKARLKESVRFWLFPDRDDVQLMMPHWVARLCTFNGDDGFDITLTEEAGREWKLERGEYVVEWPTGQVAVLSRDEFEGMFLELEPPP
jgi:hypothetical protein